MLRSSLRAALLAAATTAATAATAATLPATDALAAERRQPRARSHAPTSLLLTFRERPGLHAFVRAVSDPASSSYRRYATVEALARRFGARPRERHAVAAWAAARRLDLAVGPSGTFAVASGSRAAVAAAVGRGALAQASGRTAARRLPVPVRLRGAVGAAALLSDRRLPTTAGQRSARPRADGLPARTAQTPAAPVPLTPDELLARAFQSAAERTGTPAGCADGINAGLREQVSTPLGDVPLALLGYTPNQYTTAYGHAAMHRRGLRGEGMRVAVLEIDGFKRSDMATFARCFGTHVPKISTRVVGLRRFPAPGEETTLDLQVLMATAPRLEAIDMIATGASETKLLKGAIATLGTPRTRPDVISISLGLCEPGLAGSVIAARAVSDVFAVAAGAGISTLVSTGDNGVTGCEEAIGPSMIPAVAAPSTIPFVTAVGGTNVTLDGANRLVGQQVWNSSPGQIAGGGGGISVVFGPPWYQGGNKGGAGGRAVPDIAALGDPYPGFALYCTADVRTCRDPNPAGGWQTIGGTSAATPLMAGGVVLAAQEARRNGQPPLGLLNPLIYTIGGGRGDRGARALSDVVVGSNDVGTAVPEDADGRQPIGQFSASKGYDLASGWGSLKVSGFSKVALAAARRHGTVR